MRISWTKLAVLAAAGMWAGSASAQNINFSNTTTRAVAIQTEDSTCDNTTLPSAGFPALSLPTAGCFVFANSVGSVFTDTTNDFYGILSFNSGTSWTLTVPQSVWQVVATATFAASGATLVSTTANALTFDTASGAVAPVSPTYYTATADFGSFKLVATGEPSPVDTVYFGSANNGDTTDPGDGIPLEFSCAGTAAVGGLSVYGPAAAGAPYCVPGGGGNYLTQPGFSGTAFTSFVQTRIALADSNYVSIGVYATAPVWAPFDWRLQETPDTDKDLIPDIADTDDDNDGVLDVTDNCRARANAAQCNFDADFYGNNCDPDFNQSNSVSAPDLTAFRGKYLAANLDADMNCSGNVSAPDLTLFRGLYLNSTTTPGRLDSCLNKISVPGAANTPPVNAPYCP